MEAGNLIRGVRAALVRRFPYLAVLMLRLRLVESREFPGVVAVDRFGRVYYNPESLVRKTKDPREVAGLLLHEAYHLLFAHFKRAGMQGVREGTPAWRLWNVATDAEVNPAVQRTGLPLPEGGVFPETLGLPKGRHAEYYFAELLKRLGEEEAAILAPGEQGAPQEGGQEQAAPGGSGSEGTENQGGETQGTGQGEGEGQDSPSSQGGTQGGTQDAGSQEQEDGQGSGGASEQANSQQSQQGGQGSAGEGGSPESGGDRGSAGSGSSSGSDQQGSAKTGGKAGGRASKGGMGDPSLGGSAADGIPRPWELPPDDPQHPGLTPAEIEQIRRETAVLIRREMSLKDRGELPAGFRRLVEEFLEPKVDWQRELRARVQTALEYARGRVDYSWARPSRRDHPDFILPGPVEPRPKIAVVIDTSGSISDGELARALAEVREILRSVTDEVTYLSADAKVGAEGQARRVEQIQLVGGGGTDMRVPIARALELRPRPDVVLVITDGWTPWPDTDPGEQVPVEVIPVLLPKGKEPSVGWAREKMIKIEE